MIPRYSRPEMTSIWEPQTRFQIWFEIEAHAADALAEIGTIPKEAAKKVWEKAKGVTFNVDRIDEIERETKHDVIAFLTHLAEIVGPEARFVHQGMTSSDVLDTCLNVQLARAADLLIADIDRVLAALKTRAFEHKLTPVIGRSHGGDEGLAASRSPSVSSSPTLMPNSTATAPDSSPRGRKSQPAPSPVRSAPSRRSIRAWRLTLPKQWGSPSSRSQHR